MQWARHLLPRLFVSLACALSNAAVPVRADGELASRIHGSADFLHRQIGADGQFTYRLDARTGTSLQGRYNVLRHAGALLALAEYHLIHPPKLQQAAAMQAGWAFVRQCCLAAAGNDVPGLAVWSPVELTGGRRRSSVAKLGASGLTLAGLSQWRLVQPQSVPLELLQALGRFIVSQQADDGRFQSLYGHQGSDFDPDWASLYYPGEAILGLIMLYEQDPDIRWLRAAIDGLRYLARLREHQVHQPPDHWALIATARLWRVPAASLGAALPPGFTWPAVTARTGVAPVLRQHVLEIARSMLAGQISMHADPCLHGGFDRQGNTTPSATRLEGLLALELSGVFRPGELYLRPGIEAGMQFLLSAQHLQGPVRHAFSRKSIACRSTDARSHEVRIDYVQHALSAMLSYQAVLRSATPSDTGERSSRREAAAVTRRLRPTQAPQSPPNCASRVSGPLRPS